MLRALSQCLFILLILTGVALGQSGFVPRPPVTLPRVVVTPSTLPGTYCSNATNRTDKADGPRRHRRPTSCPMVPPSPRLTLHANGRTRRGYRCRRLPALPFSL